MCYAGRTGQRIPVGESQITIWKKKEEEADFGDSGRFHRKKAKEFTHLQPKFIKSSCLVPESMQLTSH